MLDFKGVETVGQAFDDEIFRVYARAHPAIQLHAVHANRQMAAMIARARAETMGLVRGAVKDTRGK